MSYILQDQILKVNLSIKNYVPNSRDRVTDKPPWKLETCRKIHSNKILVIFFIYFHSFYFKNQYFASRNMITMFNLSFKEKLDDPVDWKEFRLWRSSSCMIRNCDNYPNYLQKLFETFKLNLRLIRKKLSSFQKAYFLMRNLDLLGTSFDQKTVNRYF